MSQRHLYRVCGKSYDSSLYFSRKGLFRFDSPEAKWGVCYLGLKIETAVLEVFADAIRRKRIGWSEICDRKVWRVAVPSDLHVLSLGGTTLPKIGATLQCFVGRYSLSQEWARKLMDHPDDLDGLRYTGRQSGQDCLALFGDTDPTEGRWHQKSVSEQPLGLLSEWEGIFQLLDDAGARVANFPTAKPPKLWRE